MTVQSSAQRSATEDLDRLIPPRPRGRPSSNGAEAVPEERVLAAAFRSFAQRGFEGTTLRALARQLGVSHNLINVRFGSKADLWRRALDAQVQRIAPPVMAAFDVPGLEGAERIRELILRFCRWATENPDFVSLTNVEARRSSWRLDYLVEVYILPFKHRLDLLLEQTGRERPVRDISTAALMALLVEGVGFYFASGPLMQRMGQSGEISPSQVERRIVMFADFILAGLLPEAGYFLAPAEIGPVAPFKP